MKVLVIPDVHLKPWIFDKASNIMKTQKTDAAVCLGDLVDDWGQEYNISLYEQTHDAAIKFAKGFSNTLWCYGNHDISYVWDCHETGFSNIAKYVANSGLRKLRETLVSDKQIGFIHRIDNILFSHAGLCERFVNKYIPKDITDIDEIISYINTLGEDSLWDDYSPIWVRPQHYFTKMFQPEKYIQVIGHTPTKEIMRVHDIKRKNNFISCDVFSTYVHSDGVKPFGNEKFIIIDTETGEY